MDDPEENQDPCPPWIQKSVILHGIVGSTAHGLSLDGSDDRDELGVCIEPLKAAFVLGRPFEQYILRTAAQREGEQAKSQAGDLDLTIFGLRKFCLLAAAGSPSVLPLFFTPDVTYTSPLGAELRDMATVFISREAGKRFLGYMEGQRKRLIGARGQKRVKRPELEAQYGYDTKYAMHVLRLGLQGIELLETGMLTLPMKETNRTGLLEVRRGEWPLNAVLSMAHSLEESLKKRLLDSYLPEHPDRPEIESWMWESYFKVWKAQEKCR